ncbi:MAG: sodium:solute symporter, partial [Acidobacteriota bacterium]
VLLLPAHVSFGGAISLADMAGRLNVITTKMDWNDRYNLWSGLIGGCFLALAYFGTDQSQVQRYLTAKSISESRRGLLLNAVAKIPMQFFILFIGAMVFVFYIYERPPLLFQQAELARITSPAVREGYAPIESRYNSAFESRRAAADALLAARSTGDTAEWNQEKAAYDRAQQDLDAARREGAALAERSGGTRSSDTNFIFLTFVTQHLPAGLVGLVLAVIFGATMSAIAGELNALASVSVVDIYKRHVRAGATDHHYLTASRVATVFWGVYAVFSAHYAKGLGSLVEAVNVLGSLFYGGMLGVFVLAFGFPRVGPRAAFYSVLVGEAVIFACWYFTGIAFLWYNVIGCGVVVATGLLISLVERPPVRAASLDRG